MGFKSRISVSKREKQKTKGRRHFRTVSVYQQRKGNRYAKRDPNGTVHISEEALEMLSDRQITYKMKNPICNIQVTGKRRRKMLKRLLHASKENSRVEDEVTNLTSAPSGADTEPPVKTKKKRRRRGKRSGAGTSMDTGMAEASTTAEVPQTSTTDSTNCVETMDVE